jgi:hypothetical protein
VSIELPKMSIAAIATRQALERGCDATQAARIATKSTEAAAAVIVEEPSTMATALVAHTLLAHAVIASAAAWVANQTKVPLPEAHRAVLDMVLNPNAIFFTEMTVDGKLI